MGTVFVDEARVPTVRTTGDVRRVEVAAGAGEGAGGGSGALRVTGAGSGATAPVRPAAGLGSGFGPAANAVAAVGMVVAASIADRRRSNDGLPTRLTLPPP